MNKNIKDKHTYVGTLNPYNTLDFDRIPTDPKKYFKYKLRKIRTNFFKSLFSCSLGNFSAKIKEGIDFIFSSPPSPLKVGFSTEENEKIKERIGDEIASQICMGVSPVLRNRQFRKQFSFKYFKNVDLFPPKEMALKREKIDKCIKDIELIENDWLKNVG